MLRSIVRAGLCLTLALMASSASFAAEWGDLTGRFVYDGPIPEPKKVNVDRDQQVFGNLGLVDESLLVDSSGGLANVVVYCRTKNVAVNPELEQTVQSEVVYDNHGGRFVPHVMTLWLDRQTLVLSNSDPVGHNSDMRPLGDTQINPLLSAGSKLQHTFNRQQMIPVPVGCGIHPWMRGYILPRNNPYAVVSAADGTFTIPKLPAGELEFQAWHEKSGYVSTPDWDKGRFTFTVQSGTNDLGEIRLSPELFNK